VVPRLVFTKGGGLWLKDMGALDCEVLGLDWTVNLGAARALVGGAENGPGKALQGNIDPNVLFAQPQQIATEVARVLDSFGKPYHTKARARGRPISSTWAMASASTHRRSMLQPWSKRCTATPGNYAVKLHTIFCA
jgi:hypothetical protein